VNQTTRILFDEEDFLIFYKKSFNSFCFFANRYLNSHIQAEDIVSEVALRVWEKRFDLQNPNALKTYFYRAIRNACIDALRKEKAMETRFAGFSAPVVENHNILDNIIYSETLQELESALQKLPPQCKKVCINLFIEGKTLNETAEELQLSINTIKSQRQRGIKLLRHKLTNLFLIFIIGTALGFM
jgi:RNA polymerase sigma-70 factor (ECF subfamily)